VNVNRDGIPSNMEKLRNALLSDSLSLEEAEEVQNRCREIIFKQKMEFISLKNIRKIVGVDLSYKKRGNIEYGVSCASLWNLSLNKLELATFAFGEVKFPYEPGFLGFRESKLLSEAINKLQVKPDLIMCDGHGIIHPKRFGEAVQLGFALNIPSIGIAKNPFIGFSQWKQLERKKGNKNPIFDIKPNDENVKKPNLLGYSLCLNDGMKPIFISKGYKITLDLAVKVALETTKNHRLPEPLFLADRLSREKLNII